MVISTLRNVQKVQIQIYMRTTTPALKMNPPLKFKCLLYVSFFFLKKKKVMTEITGKNTNLPFAKTKGNLDRFIHVKYRKFPRTADNFSLGSQDSLSAILQLFFLENISTFYHCFLQTVFVLTALCFLVKDYMVRKKKINQNQETPNKTNTPENCQSICTVWD